MMFLAFLIFRLLKHIVFNDIKHFFTFSISSGFSMAKPELGSGSRLPVKEWQHYKEISFFFTLSLDLYGR